MKRGRIPTPKTPEEWQVVVDYAYGLLALDSARSFGLVEGGPGVNVKRCTTMLDRGREAGYTPAPDAIERTLEALLEADELDLV